MVRRAFRPSTAGNTRKARLKDETIKMSTLNPLESLYEATDERASALPLPQELFQLYGKLQFRTNDQPYLFGNFVTTMDGVVTLDVPGKSGGGEISGFNAHDRMVMGLLRAIADAVIVGAGTLRATPNHLWTAGHAFPPLAEAYQALQTSLGKLTPLNVVVTASGEINLRQRVFQSGEVPALIITTARGAERIHAQEPLPLVRIAVLENPGHLPARDILDAIQRAKPSRMILVEGGPHLLGHMLAEKCLDELFLTLAPQIAGRDRTVERPGFDAGKIFAPEQPLWNTLMSVKRGENHLFLRYALQPQMNANQRE
jgi:riboflavin biosynthesis pyrimidine reductase